MDSLLIVLTSLLLTSMSFTQALQCEVLYAVYRHSLTLRAEAVLINQLHYQQVVFKI